MTLKLRRELAAEVAKARDSSAKERRDSEADTALHEPIKVATTEAQLEQKSDGLRREASRAGLLVAVLFVLIAAVGLLTVISFWPVFTSAPVTDTAHNASDGLEAPWVQNRTNHPRRLKLLVKFREREANERERWLFMGAEHQSNGDLLRADPSAPR